MIVNKNGSCNPKYQLKVLKKDYVCNYRDLKIFYKHLGMVLLLKVGYLISRLSLKVYSSPSRRRSFVPVLWIVTDSVKYRGYY